MVKKGSEFFLNIYCVSPDLIKNSCHGINDNSKLIQKLLVLTKALLSH